MEPEALILLQRRNTKKAEAAAIAPMGHAANPTSGCTEHREQSQIPNEHGNNRELVQGRSERLGVVARVVQQR